MVSESAAPASDGSPCWMSSRTPARALTSVNASAPDAAAPAPSAPPCASPSTLLVSVRLPPSEKTLTHGAPPFARAGGVAARVGNVTGGAALGVALVDAEEGRRELLRHEHRAFYFSRQHTSN